MRNGETHFDQVPMEVVETIVRRAAALAAVLGKSPALVSELDRQARQGQGPGARSRIDEPRFPSESEDQK